MGRRVRPATKGELMSNERFSSGAETALRFAQQSAGELGHDYVGTEHLLLGLMREESGLAHAALVQAGLTEEALMDTIRRLEGGGLPLGDPSRGLTPRAKRVVEMAVEEAARLGERSVDTGHLLSALLREGGNMGVRTLRAAGVDTRGLYTALLQKQSDSPRGRVQREKPPAREETGKTLRECSRDLTAEARTGRHDPVIGREGEIDRLVQILSRRTKNNPCLLGEPGVGKTAIVEGLAGRIADGAVPPELQDQRILSLDIAGMVAGTKYRGEFEERIRRIIDEVKRAGNIILFLDELHTVVGAGSAEGAVDAANIIKPALGRGELRLIGATTLTEYRKYIEKDAALERRFQPITVAEPTPEEAYGILRGLRRRYETHHRLTITDQALRAAVDLSVRYITGRFLPDKAIDLMDEAASRVRMAGTLRSVTEEDVAAVVALWTGIPVTHLTQSEGDQLLHMEEILHRRVVGQEEAVSALCRCIRRSRVGLKDPRRPIGSFLFLGPTGVGKTELCKALAEVLFGREEALLRFDMSEYMERHTVSRLIGSPPGYIGHEEGGELTEKVRRRPYSVVLFDEMEKAHEDIWNLLLQIMDDGHITDAQGRRVDFRNTVIVMTSNLGARRLSGGGGTLGFSVGDRQMEKEEAVRRELKEVFRPEFLSRVDETIVFRTLEACQLTEIVRRMLSAISERMEALGIGLEADETAVAALAAAGFADQSGARALRRILHTQVEDAVAEEILTGRLKAGDTAALSAREGSIVVRAATLT